MARTPPPCRRPPGCGTIDTEFGGGGGGIETAVGTQASHEVTIGAGKNLPQGQFHRAVMSLQPANEGLAGVAAGNEAIGCRRGCLVMRPVGGSAPIRRTCPHAQDATVPP